MAANTHFRFDREEWLLFGSALNEVLHGFAVRDFENTIGESKATVEKLRADLDPSRDTGELTLQLLNTRIVRNALRETIRELGAEEFHARTGYGFEHGKVILARLDDLIAGCTSH